MKLRSLILFFIGGILCTNTIATAQLLGDQIFLQGRWLEVAVAPNGCWGNTRTVPAGYHTHTGGTIGGYPDPLTGAAATGNGMDFSYDVGHDGWTVGSPATTQCCFYGPFFLPGTPFDGWSVQMNGVRSDAFYTSAGFATSGGATFTGTNVDYQYTPGSMYGPFLESTSAGKWAGTYNAGGGTLSIRSQNRVDTNASWDLVTVTFKNTGATPITGLYYLVTGDPDNDQPMPGSFPTNNHISYQETVPPYRHEVNARPPAANQDAFSGLATKDCRSKAFIYQSWPPPLVAGNNLDLIYSGTATSIGTANYGLYATTSSQDIAYGLIYNLGNLAPGDSTRISFAWIFADTSGIDSAFQDPRLLVNADLQAAIDTYNVCGLPTIPLSIIHGEWGCTNWKWEPATGLSSTTGISTTLDPSALTGEITYTITGDDTTSCSHWRFLLTIPSCFSAGSNSPDTSRICEDDTLRLFTLGDTTGASYIWRGPGITGPIRGYFQGVKIPHITLADTGWYYVIKTIGGVNDTERTHVLIKPKPIIIATYNAPLCSGNTLILTSTPDSVGETWSWTGPDGFTSILSDPTRTPAPTTYSGLYTVVATFNGCVDSTTINVVIDSTPAVPTCTSNSYVCEDSTLMLFSTCATPGVTYSWVGPSGFTSTMQNPVIPNVPMTAMGTYTVTVRRGLCTNTNTTVVEIRPKPTPVLSSNSPVCSGSALNLNTTAPAGTPSFMWWGPNSFTSGVQNPSINPAFTMNTGNYTVVVRLNGCNSDTMSIYAIVDSTPEAPVLTTNSPGAPGESICESDTLLLTALSATSGVGYSWTGPNSFATTIQNPVVYSVTTAASGVYTVVVSIGSCSVTAAITVTITATPPITATSNTPICSGSADTLFLQATSLPGASFTWSGPYTFFSSAQNPSRTPVSTEYGGTYIVTVLLDGCTNVATHNVVVNPTPAPPWVKWLTYCQYYDAPYLQAFGTNVLWYPSSSSTSGSPTPPKPSTDVVGVSFYFANQTALGCPSAIDSIKVTVNPTPTVTVSNDTTVCPHDSVTLRAVNTDAIAYYKWYPDMYLNDTSKATVVSHPETNIEYTVVSSNMYGCTDTATVNVTVKANANFFLEDSITLFPGETYHIQPSTNCSYFNWTPAGGLSGKYISDPIASPEVSTKYVVTGITEWGCKTKDSINININTEAVLSVPNAFAPGSINGKFKVIRRGQATLRYFRVYDRWGIVVFETKDIDEGWDGTYKGTPQPVGVYIYDIGATSISGKPFNKTGNVTLLR